MAIPLNVFFRILKKLSSNPIFADIQSWETDHPFCRPSRPTSFQKIRRSTAKTYIEYAGLTINRLLTVLYEVHDFTFLPDTGLDLNEFSCFYDDDLRSMAAIAMPWLEEYALGFVDVEVSVTGKWNKAKFEDYFANRVGPLMGHVPTSLDLVAASKYPVPAAEMLLIQHAPDFLTEASHMGRKTLGDYGRLQSEFFKVLIDEMGYGVHAMKHSTLFKHTLESVGLRSHSHAYWQFYLGSTLRVNNYFHRVTSRPRYFFRYLGAITLAENTFGPYCEAVARTLRSVYGDKVDTRYYREHSHIDDHHGRMTYEDLLLGAIDRYGDQIIADLVRGIEQTLYLQDLAERDLAAQLIWMSKKDEYHQLGMEIRDAVLADKANLPVAHLIEPKGLLSVCHTHDGDELCVVDRGVLRFASGPNSFVDLQAGQAMIIAKNRLHGAVPLSNECHYNIFSIQDYRRYANRQI